MRERERKGEIERTKNIKRGVGERRDKEEGEGEKRRERREEA